jgi:hypothetical protein
MKSLSLMFASLEPDMEAPPLDLADPFSITQCRRRHTAPRVSRVHAKKVMNHAALRSDLRSQKS